MAIGIGSHLAYALDAGGVCSELLRRRAESTPEDPLLLFGNARWTYGECWRQSLRFGTFLTQTAGLNQGRGGRLVIFLNNRPEAVFAWFGAQLAGFTSVLVNRGHRGPLLDYQLRQSRGDMLLTDAEGLAHICDSTAWRPHHVVMCDTDGTTGNRPADVLSWSAVCAAADTNVGKSDLRRPSAGDLCSVLFTSGTAGRSKAVRIPQQMIARGAARLADAFGFRPSDIYHGWLPLYHIGGLLHTLMAMIVCGGAVALIPRFSLSRFWDEVRRYQCSVFAGFGSTISLLWNLSESSTDSASSLRVGLCAMCPPKILRKFEQRFGVLLLDSYGMTEVEPISLPTGPFPLPPGSCGKANPDFEVSIVDKQDYPVGPNEIGEIVVRPRVPHSIMQGYEDDPDATVVAFRNLWMHTGDLGRIDGDGFIYIAGRIKEMIRRRGENMSPWEIESILKSHPAIRDCAAVGIPTETGEEEVKVAVVPATGTDLTHAQMLDICRSLLSTFMLPRFVEIRESLPLNHMGKVDKNELRHVDANTVDLTSLGMV